MNLMHVAHSAGLAYAITTIPRNHSDHVMTPCLGSGAGVLAPPPAPVGSGVMVSPPVPPMPTLLYALPPPRTPVLMAAAVDSADATAAATPPVPGVASPPAAVNGGSGGSLCRRLSGR